MKVFNGTYVEGDLGKDVEVKIFYDGKVWNFKSRTWYRQSVREEIVRCDTTAVNPIDFTVKEGDTIQAESSLLDFLGISRLEQEDMKLSGWKFQVDLQNNVNENFYLEDLGTPTVLGALEFYGVGQGEPTICGRFQVGIVDTPEQEEEELLRWYLTLDVTGSVYNSVLYWKDDEEVMHVS